MSDCNYPYSWRWYFGLALLVLSGCQTAGNQGPIYKLQVPEIAAPATPVAVSITDKRPDKERSYRRGGVQPAEYQDGIESLTLDNFEPQVTEVLKQMFAQRLSLLSRPPVWADIEVTRFRALIDRREILAAEYERQLLNGQAGPTVGFGVGMGGGPGGAAGIAGGVASGLMAAAATAGKIREIDEQRTSWDHAMFGVTCEIEMHVQLHWQDGHREVFDLQSKAHSMPQDNERFVELMNNKNWSISPTVEQAIVQIGDKLRLQAEAATKGSTSIQTSESFSQPAERLPSNEQHRGAEATEDGFEPLPPPLKAASSSDEPRN